MAKTKKDDYSEQVNGCKATIILGLKFLKDHDLHYDVYIDVLIDYLKFEREQLKNKKNK